MAVYYRVYIDVYRCKHQSASRTSDIHTSDYHQLYAVAVYVSLLVFSVVKSPNKRLPFLQAHKPNTFTRVYRVVPLMVSIGYMC